MTWLMSVFTFKRFIFYGFLLYLVLAEYAIRFLLSFVPGRTEDLAIVSTSSTVTAAGLSLIAAVLIPKPMVLDAQARQLLRDRKAKVIGELDHNLIYAAYLALLLLPFAWGWAMWMVHSESTEYDINLFSSHVPGPFLVGLCIYLVGMIFTEVKEVA